MKNHHHNSPIHPKPVVARPSAESAPPHEAIVARAEALWIGHGRPENQDEPIWLEAEGQLRAEQRQTAGNPILSIDS
jgi:hypothetical protein